MNTSFDDLAVRVANRSSRRTFLGYLAKAGAGAALALSVAPVRRAGAQTCAYGPNTCQSGFVWREAWAGDLVCVDPSQRDQAAYDNAAAASRVDPNGAYGPSSCQVPYVWRGGYDGDAVCVEPWVRDQVATDNYYAASRFEAGCVDGGVQEPEEVEEEPPVGGGGGGGGEDDWGPEPCDAGWYDDAFGNKGYNDALCMEADEEPDV